MIASDLVAALPATIPPGCSVEFLPTTTADLVDVVVHRPGRPDVLARLGSMHATPTADQFAWRDRTMAADCPVDHISHRLALAAWVRRRLA